MSVHPIFRLLIPPALIALGLGTTAVAQTSDPGAAAAKIERRIDETVPNREGRRDTREATQETLPEAQPAAPAEAAEPAFQFTLAAVSISGATMFTPAELAPFYEDLLATRITDTEAAEIAQRITRKYVDAGYILSRAIVPPQQILTGVLQIRVIEGYVSEINISGVDPDAFMIEPFTRNILAARPLTLSLLERAILLLSDSAGMNVEKSQFDDGNDEGAYGLNIELSHDLFDGGFYTDNRGTPSVGRSILLIGGGANQSLGFGESLKIGYSTVPTEPTELQYGEVRYIQPIGGDGLQATGAVSYSEVDGGSSDDVADVNSETFRGSLQLAYPVIRSRLANFWLNGFFDYRDSDEYRFDQKSYEDRLRVARVRANLTLRDDWQGTNWVIGTLSQGLDIFGASETGSPNLSRSDGRAKFTKFHLDLGRTQDIGQKYAIEIAGIGQKSSAPLLSAEEFGLGGSRFGRAYDFSEITGEDGLAGSIEFRRMFQTGDPFVEDVQLYGFYDIGAVWNRNAFTSEFSRQSLSSAGVGVRTLIAGWARLNLELAKPLTRPVYTSNNDNGPRGFFSLSSNF